MDGFNELFREATGGITEEYYRLPIDGGPSIYRERVYCYELYHQMRLRWPENCDFTLNGEVDKRRHPIIDDNKIPDFLIHTPGSMGGNDTIIEVKAASRLDARDARADLEKLSHYISSWGYQTGIYLIFGDDSVEKINQIVQPLLTSNLQSIEVWCHDGCNTKSRTLAC